jgi:hypothetical protein
MTHNELHAVHCYGDPLQITCLVRSAGRKALFGGSGGRRDPRGILRKATCCLQVRLRQGEDDVMWQVLARGPESCAGEDLRVLQDYFNLHEPLGEMCKAWADKDARFKLISPFLPGRRKEARV